MQNILKNDWNINHAVGPHSHTFGGTSVPSRDHLLCVSMFRRNEIKYANTIRLGGFKVVNQSLSARKYGGILGDG